MLFILNKSYEVVGTLNSKGDLSKITTYFDDKYTQDLGTGAETFQFSVAANSTQAQHLVSGNFVAFKENGEFKLFNIINIEETHEEIFMKEVYCEMASIELINKIVRPMEVLNSSLRKFLESILEDTEWQLGKMDIGFTQVYDFKVTDYKSVYELIQEYAVGTYGAEISYRVEIENGVVVGKYIDCYAERGKDNGFRFYYGSNLSSVVKTVDSSNLATALIGVGKNGLTFKSVEAPDKPLNSDFIANETAFEQWNVNGNHIFGVHNADTESPQELLRLTRIALEERANPQIKYEMKAELLGKNVGIGDTVYVVDHEFNPPLHLSARVNQLITSKTDPNSNEVVLANFKEVNSNITEEMRSLASQLEGYVDSQFPISGDKIQDGAIGKQQFSKEYHTELIADAVYASLVETEELIAGKADIGDLTAINAKIENLKVEKADITELHAQKAEIENLVAEKAEIEDLKATNAQIENLKANKADIDDLHATNATIGELQANKADITELNVVKGSIEHLETEVAEIGTLKSDIADIEHILAGNITADNIQTGAITAGSGIIADGAIGNAQISQIDAGKIEAGTIDTSKVTIQGSNGHLRLKGNRMQVFEGTGNQAKERVSVGDVNGDGTKFGLRVRGADGQTILLDENGVTSEGITDGSITNDKISDNAEIDGAKLNINSVVSKINEDGTETIQGTKIEVDGTTLNTKLSSITTKQTEDSNRITQAQSQITANANAIKLKVDEQTYTTDKKDMTSKLEKNTSEISTMKGQIALKVEQTDIENAKNELEGTIDIKIDSAKADIKITTDAISQNVSNLSQTVSTKADGSTVSSLNSKVSSLETSVNGISGKVTSLEKTTTTLGTQVNTANTNASSALNKANSATTTANNAQNTANTNKSNITNLQGEVSTVKSNVASLEVTTSGISQKVSSVESTTATLSGKVNTANNNAINALNKANSANTLADSKAKVFTTTPTVPYKVGDLWVQGTNGDVMKCKTARASGSYTASDWEKASKYTDDTKANAVDGKVTTLQGTVNTTNSKVATLETNLNGITQRVSSTESTTATLTTKVNTIEGTANTAKSTADSAKTTATNAQNSANSANSKIEGLQIGGRNLIRNSQNYSNWLGENGTTVSTIDNSNEPTKILQVTTNSSASGHVKINVSNYTKGKEYILSFYAKNISGDKTINFEPHGGPVYSVTSTSEWVQYKVKIIPNLNWSSISPYFYFNNKNNTSVFQIKNVKLEEGNKATDWTPAPEDVDGAINSVDSKVDTLRTEYNSTKSKVATIETNLSGITSRVSSVETNIEKISNASSQNLLYNSDFRIINGSLPDGWSTDSSKITLDPNTTLLDGIPTFWFNVTGLTENAWKAVYSPFISAKAGEKFVASAYVIGHNNWSVLDAGGGLEIEYYNDSGRISTSGTSINKSNLNWQRLVAKGIAPTGTTKVRIRVHPVRNGQFNMSKPMLQYGETVTGWDRGFDINNLTTRLKTAESKITEDAITNTVKKNFYTKSETNSQITSKGYQTASQVQQTVDNLQLKFTQSGGYNLLKNSAFANNSFDKWWTWGPVTRWTNLTYYKEEGDMYIANSSTTDAGGLWQDIETPILPNTEYTLSVLVSKEGNVKGGYFAMEYQETVAGSHFTSQVINLTFDGKRHSYTFTTPNDSRIKYAKCGFRHDGSNSDSGGFLIRINKPCLTTGRVNVWSPHPNEIYDGITTIDKDGITVRQSNISTYTSMDASSFRVENNTGGTVAEFSQNSQIPNLTAGIINANEVYSPNICTKSPMSGSIKYIVNGSTGNDNNNGTYSSPFKTVSKAISMLNTQQDRSVDIEIYGSVTGFDVKGINGTGAIRFYFSDDAIVNGAVIIGGITNTIGFHGGSSDKPTFKNGISIYRCRDVEIGSLTFRGTNSSGTNIYLEDVTFARIMGCDLGGLSTQLLCAIQARRSNLWIYNCRGSKITDVVAQSEFSIAYAPRAGTSNVPDYSNAFLCNYDGDGRIHNWSGGNFVKTPSKGWNPAYTPTQKTQTWNFNKVWSDETLNGWSDRQELIQGYASTWNTGRWTGYMQFTDGMAAIRSTISGGTNFSGRLYVQRRTSSGNSTGSKLCLYASDGTLITNSTTINRGQGVWVTLSSAIISKIASGAITYFYLKADSNNSATYFKCESNAKIEITYTK